MIGHSDRYIQCIRVHVSLLQQQMIQIDDDDNFDLQ